MAPGVSLLGLSHNDLGVKDTLLFLVYERLDSEPPQQEATPEVTKEEPIPEKLEEEHIKSRTTPSDYFVVPNETIKRSMSSAKPLREFEPMDWVPINYGEVFDKRRPFPNQKGMARALEVDFPPERKAEESYDLETIGEIFQKLFGDDEVDPEHIAEVKESWGSSPKHHHTLASLKFTR
jgi:hypothetical protein